MRYTKEQQRTIVLAVLAIFILAVGFYYLSFKNNLKALRILRPQIQRLKLDARSIRKDLSTIEILRKQIRDTKDRSRFAEGNFVHSEETTPILEKLSAIANESRVKIVQMRPLKSVTGPRYGRFTVIDMPVSIRFKGTYHNIGRFINGVENSVLFMKLTDIAIESDYNDVRNHDAEFIVSAYAVIELGS